MNTCISRDFSTIQYKEHVVSIFFLFRKSIRYHLHIWYPERPSKYCPKREFAKLHPKFLSI